MQEGSKEPRLTFVCAHSHANVLTVGWFYLFPSVAFQFWISSTIYGALYISSHPDITIPYVAFLCFYFFSFVFQSSNKHDCIALRPDRPPCRPAIIPFCPFCSFRRQLSSSLMSSRDLCDHDQRCNQLSAAPFHYWDTDTTAPSIGQHHHQGQDQLLKLPG